MKTPDIFGATELGSQRHTAGATTALIVRFVESRGGLPAVEEMLRVAADARTLEELTDERTWSTYDQKIALFEAAATVLEDPDVARHVGETVLDHRVGVPIRAILRALGSPSQVLKNIARAAPKFSTVAVMEAEEVAKEHAVVAYRLADGFTPNRMDCDYNVGLLSQVPPLFGLDPASITHTECQVHGAERCVYLVRWHDKPRGVARARRSALEEQLATISERYDALQLSVGDLVSPDDLDEVLGRIASRAAHVVRAQSHVLSVQLEGEAKPRVLHEGVALDVAQEVLDQIERGDETIGFSVLTVDIHSARRSYGRLCAIYEGAQLFFGEERKLLETYAHHAAAALDVAEALNAARQETATSNALIELANALAGAHSRRDLAIRLADKMPSIVGGASASVLLWDETKGCLQVEAMRGAYDDDRQELIGLEIPLNATPELRRMIEARSLQSYRREDTDDPYIRGMLDQYELEEVFAAPITSNNIFLGVVSAGRRADDPPFVSERVLTSRMKGISDQVGTAFENVRLVAKLRESIHDLRREVVDRQRAEAEVRTVQAQTRALFDGTPVGLYRVSLEGEILDANRALAEVLAADTAQSLIGRNVSEFYVDQSDRSDFLQLMGEGGVVSGKEMLLRRADGSLIWVRDDAREVYDHGLEVTYFEGSLEDVTERKKAEEDRDRLGAQLMQAQKLDAIGRLAGGVAHDFNNLLAVISNFAGFVYEDLPEGDPRRDDIDEIRSASERGAKLVRQLLAFSRREMVASEVVDLNDAVADVEALLMRTLGEDVELETLAEPDLWPTRIDPGQLHQILLNLAVNSREAMPQGGKLTIETTNGTFDGSEDYEATIPPGNYVRLCVSDTGVGMTDEVRGQVFEPFFTTKDRGTGSGLGLAMVYGIVKQADGFVWVTSEPGAGTSIEILLPTSEGAIVLDDETPDSPASVVTGEKVILVEDEPAVRRLVERILSRAGYQVVSAASGNEALGLVTEHPDFALLLTDVIMPRMSGKELYDELTRQGLKFKTIFMSGYTDQIVAKAGVESEGHEFIQKPFTADALVQTVMTALRS